MVLTGGIFGMPDGTSAVIIPLLKYGDPLIEYVDARGVYSTIDWNAGSVIYLAGNSNVRSNGRGNASCIFFLFKMRA